MIFIAFYSTSMILSDFQWSEERAWRRNVWELRTLPPKRNFSKQNHKPSTRTPVLNSEPRTHSPLYTPSHKARWRKLQYEVWQFESRIAIKSGVMISIPPESKNPNGIIDFVQTGARPDRTLPEARTGPDRTEPEARSQKPEAGKRSRVHICYQKLGARSCQGLSKSPADPLDL